MVNGVEIVVGGVAGAAFGLIIIDGVKEIVLNALEFTPSHTNVKSTLEALQPLLEQIAVQNTALHVPDEELKDLKEKMEAGVKRVQELSEESVWNSCMRPFHTMELDNLDQSLKRLLEILHVQRVRDCKTDVKGILAWTSKTSDHLVEEASNGKETLDLARKIDSVLDRFERIGFVPTSDKVASSVEEESPGSSLQTMPDVVDEALSKPPPFNLDMGRSKRLHGEIFLKIKVSL